MRASRHGNEVVFVRLFIDNKVNMTSSYGSIWERIFLRFNKLVIRRLKKFKGEKFCGKIDGKKIEAKNLEATKCWSIKLRGGGREFGGLLTYGWGWRWGVG